MAGGRWRHPAKGDVLNEVPYPKALAAFPTIRQSVLSAYDNCMLEAKFERETREGWSHPWQARGQLFHRVAGRCLAEMYKQKENEISVDVALAILVEVLRQHDIDKECPHCGSDRIRKGVTRQGMRRCLACNAAFESEFVAIPAREIKDLRWVTIKFAHDNVWDIQNLVDVEQRLRAPVAYPNPQFGIVERIVSGRLDALFVEGDEADHAIVLDHKDTWALPSQTEVSFEGYFQQRFYAYLVMSNYPSVQRVTTREFYVRYSESREATIHRVDLDDIREELSALVERFDRSVEDDVWVPSPGKHCGICPLPERCPIVRNVRGEGMISDEDHAAKVAAELVVAERVRAKSRQALSAYTERHGPVPVKDAKGKRVFGHRPVETTTRPTLEEIEQATRMKGDSLTLHEMKALYKVRRGSRFESFAPLPEPDEAEEDRRVLAQLEDALARAAERVGV